MHAALIKFTIDPDQARAAEEALSDHIPRRSVSLQGFLAGYWVEPVDGRGFSFVVFETEEQARQSTPPEADWGAPGITIDEVEFWRVAESARFIPRDPSA